MAFPESFLQELAERNDIVDVVGSYVRLTKRAGRTSSGSARFTAKRRRRFPSRPISRSTTASAAARAAASSASSWRSRISFPEAVAFLANRAGMQLPEQADDPGAKKRQRLLALNRDAARFFPRAAQDPAGQPARDYLARRQLTAQTVTRFGLGFAPDTWDSLVRAMKALGYSEQELFDGGLVRHGKSGGVYDTFRNRLMFPVIDVRGNVIGFSGRILGGGEPKYMNSPETIVFSKRATICSRSIWLKSQSAGISYWQRATSTWRACTRRDLTARSPRSARRSRRSRRGSCRATRARSSSPTTTTARGRRRRSARSASSKSWRCACACCRCRGAKDPDEYIKTFGADAFRNLLEQSENHIDYRLGAVQRKYDLQIDEQRVAFVKEAAGIVAELPGSVEREVYAMRVAETAGMPAAVVTDEVQRQRKRRLSRARKEQERDLLRPATAIQPPGRSIRFDDPRSAAAEQGIIRLLYLDPGLFYGRTNVPDAAQFSSPELRHILHRPARPRRHGHGADRGALGRAGAGRAGAAHGHHPAAGGAFQRRACAR